MVKWSSAAAGREGKDGFTPPPQSFAKCTLEQLLGYCKLYCMITVLKGLFHQPGHSNGLAATSSPGTPPTCLLSQSICGLSWPSLFNLGIPCAGNFSISWLNLFSNWVVQLKHCKAVRMGGQDLAVDYIFFVFIIYAATLKDFLYIICEMQCVFKL